MLSELRRLSRSIQPARHILAHGMFEVAKSEQLLLALELTADEVSLSFVDGLVVTDAGEVLLPAIWRNLDAAVLARSFGRGLLMGVGVYVGVLVHDRMVESLTNDIQAVLSRGRY